MACMQMVFKKPTSRHSSLSSSLSSNLYPRVLNAEHCTLNPKLDPTTPHYSLSSVTALGIVISINCSHSHVMKRNSLAPDIVVVVRCGIRALIDSVTSSAVRTEWMEWNGWSLMEVKGTEWMGEYFCV